MKVHFISVDGERRSFVAKSGDTLLDVALDNGVPGIHGQCGGGCTCCTCHCYIDESWLAKLNQPHQDELDMLAYAWQRQHGSRLACQVSLDAIAQGDGQTELRVTVPAQQS